MRPTSTQKLREFSNCATTIQRSHSNTSLPQPSLQRRHTRFGRCAPHFTSPKFARVATSPPTIQKSYRNTSFFSFFFVVETRAFGRCVFTAAKISSEPPTPQRRRKGPTVTPRFLRLPCRRDTCLCAVRRHFTPTELRVFPPFQPRFKKSHASSAFSTAETRNLWAVRPHISQKLQMQKKTSPPTMQKSHRNTSLPQPSPQRRHTPSGGASPLHLKKVLRELPPLQPRCKSPTFTPRFPQPSLQRRHTRFRALGPHFNLRKVRESFHLSNHNSRVRPCHLAFLILLCSGDTRLWAVRLHCFQNFGEFPTLQPRFKGLTVTPRFLSLLYSRDTRLWAVRPHISQKIAKKKSTSPPTMRRSHRNTSLPQPSPTAETHAFSGGASSLQPNSLREFPLLQPQFKRSHRVTSLSAAIPHSRDTRLWAVRPNFNQKNGRVSTFPTTIQSSHRNTSLSSAFPTAETRAFGR